MILRWLVQTGWVKNTVLGHSVPLKNEGENNLLVNGENQAYPCVLGWAGNPNIHQMVILPEPDSDGERLVMQGVKEYVPPLQVFHSKM